MGNDARRGARQRRLGPDGICVLCGYDRPEGLVSVHRSVLEEHHVVGRANDSELTVLLCRNCHAEITEEYRACGVSMAPPLSVIELAITSLRALAVFLSKLAHFCTRLAAELERELRESRPRGEPNDR